MVQSNLIKVGVFGSPVGLKGEVKIKILTSSFDFFKKLNDYCDSEESVYWTFEKVRLKNPILIILVFSILIFFILVSVIILSFTSFAESS